jgi:hypothetical protein
VIEQEHQPAAVEFQNKPLSAASITVKIFCSTPSITSRNLSGCTSAGAGSVHLEGGHGKTATDKQLEQGFAVLRFLQPFCSTYSRQYHVFLGQDISLRKLLLSNDQDISLRKLLLSNVCNPSPFQFLAYACSNYFSGRCCVRFRTQFCCRTFVYLFAFINISTLV